MLKILNSLAPFFEDSAREIAVREYAKLAHVSPPTASKLLKKYARAGYLHQRAERGHLLFTLNYEINDTVDLSRLYWKKRLEPLSITLQEKLSGASAILFGSLAKAEATPASDADIAILTPEKKPIDLAPLEKALRRKISLHWFTSLRTIKNEHLLNNILNGTVLFGKVRW
ncbi:hypothetical protein C4580_06385 [Candidatus Woesearchaeota archaeon]|nr:MAG: hypothetical protein C4580_06385 [Candidatus Woesearchaeota archaeon]